MAEALVNHRGAGRFRAFSAGSHPRGSVHPLALETLRRHGLPADGFRSKSWDELAAPGATPIDLIVTVCDNAAQEACPMWPGRPATQHWSIADPAAVTGPDAPRAFEDAFRDLETRITALIADGTRTRG
jgi:arsenate reductase